MRHTPAMHSNQSDTRKDRFPFSLVTYRSALFLLLKRDFFYPYRKSVFSAAWVIIAPVGGVISWLILHSTNIIRSGNLDIPYPVYVIAGSFIWGIFMTCYRSASQTFTASRNILLSVPIPHDVILVAQIGTALLQSVIPAASLITVGAILGHISFTGLLIFPVLLIPLGICAIAAGLTAGMFAAFSYDIQKIVSGAVSLLLFITPVVYTADSVPQSPLKIIITYNPLTHLIGTSRDMLIYGRISHTEGYLGATLLSFLLLLWVWRAFSRARYRIVERML